VYLRFAGGRGVAEESNRPRRNEWLERTRVRYGQQMATRSVRMNRNCWRSICGLSMDDEALLRLLGRIQAVCVMLQVAVKTPDDDLEAAGRVAAT
jgi:hypothetical protein